MFDPNAPLSGKLAEIRKLVLSVVGTGFVLGYWLLSGDHSAEEVFAAVLSYLGYNYGVWRVPNATKS